MAIFVFGSQKTTKAFSTWCPNWGSTASFQTEGWLTEASLSCRELNENMPVLRFGFRPSKMLVLNWKIKRTLSSGGAIWKSVQACFCAQGWLFDSSSSRRSRTSVMKQGWPQLPVKRHLVHLVFPERNHKPRSCSHAGIEFDWSSLWFLHLPSEGKLQEKRRFFAQTVNNSNMAEKLSHEPCWYAEKSAARIVISQRFNLQSNLTPEDLSIHTWPGLPTCFSLLLLMFETFWWGSAVKSNHKNWDTRRLFCFLTGDVCQWL